MKLKLVAYTPNIETMVATSMLTTTSGAQPSTLYKRLLANPEKVKKIVERVEVQHGNILEHNRVIWELEASSEEVLEVILNSKFFNFTKLENSRWIVSSNLRSVAEYSQNNSGVFIDMIIESIRETTPQIYGFIMEGAR